MSSGLGEAKRNAEAMIKNLDESDSQQPTAEKKERSPSPIPGIKRNNN